MWYQIFQDAFFAAIAAIGFAAISRPPRSAYLYCAVIAAIGHSVRFWLMNVDFGCSMHIVPSTLVASFIVGIFAVFLSPLAKTPAETCLFPALLPMIPGIYAYKTFGGIVMCVINQSQDAFTYYFYQFAYNGFTCGCLLICMAIGSTLPIFIFERISFQATRQKFL